MNESVVEEAALDWLQSLTMAFYAGRIIREPRMANPTIVVITDEAHRGQYDFMDGFARHMRDALPNVSYIGFTGTPLELTDRNTRAVFGEYISVYDIQRAVEEGATVPIYYESRLAKLNLDEIGSATAPFIVATITQKGQTAASVGDHLLIPSPSEGERVGTPGTHRCPLVRHSRARVGRQLHSAKLSWATLRHARSEQPGLPDVLGSRRACVVHLPIWQAHRCGRTFPCFRRVPLPSRIGVPRSRTPILSASQKPKGEQPPIRSRDTIEHRRLDAAVRDDHTHRRDSR